MSRDPATLCSFGDRRGRSQGVIGGASYGELGFVALLVIIVLVAPLVSRLGEAIGARFERGAPPRKPG